MPLVTDFKFGRQAAVHPVGYPMISHVVDALPTAPNQFDHTGGYNAFQIMGNGPDPSLSVNHGNAVGDCAFCATVNIGVVDAVATQEPVTQPSSNEVVTEYLKYDRGQDVGANLNELLAYWRSVGLPWSPKLPAYAGLNFRDWDEFWCGCNAYSTVMLGIAVTETMMTQTQLGEPWDLTGQAGDDNVLGGHAVDVISRLAVDQGEVVTWGLRQKFTQRWFQKQVEEAHILITAQQVARGGDGYGLSLAKLQAALDRLN